jgi:hypothetical protein
VVRRWTASAMLAFLLGGCGILGASQITVSARNESEQEMVVQVIGGMSDDAARHGEAYTIAPGREEQLTLAVPGGDWTVTVNGAMLVSTSDAGDRRGELPVTLVLPDPDEFDLGPYWEAPQGWGITAP